MKFKLEFDMDNDAFWVNEEYTGGIREPDREAVYNLLREIGKQFWLSSAQSKPVRDSNGNTIGKWEITDNES